MKVQEHDEAATVEQLIVHFVSEEVEVVEVEVEEVEGE